MLSVIIIYYYIDRKTHHNYRVCTTSIVTTGRVTSLHSDGYYLLLFGSTFILYQRPIDTIVIIINYRFFWGYLCLYEK